MVRYADTLYNKLKQFCGSNKPILCIGHNAWNFDIKIINNACKKYNIYDYYK